MKIFNNPFSQPEETKGELTEEQLARGNKRKGYRLRRNHYRNVELEPLTGHDDEGEFGEDGPEAGTDGNEEGAAGELHAHAQHGHSHGHAHGHGHSHAASRESDKVIEALREQLLRSQAEFENFRKRTRREELQRIDLASQKVVEQLLPVVDNLGRGLNTPGSTLETLRSGLSMVLKQFEDVLAQQGLEKVDPTGQPFDPTQHEAVGVVNDSQYPDNTVAEVFQPGYMMRGRLIRPAMVRVSRAS